MFLRQINESRVSSGKRSLLHLLIGPRKISAIGIPLRIEEPLLISLSRCGVIRKFQEGSHIDRARLRRLSLPAPIAETHRVDPGILIHPAKQFLKLCRRILVPWPQPCGLFHVISVKSQKPGTTLLSGE